MSAFRRIPAQATLAAAIALLVSAGSAGDASAEGYRRHARSYASMPPYVIAESRYGNGTVRGALRMGRVGPQVQLPGGNWVDCGRNCAETLRRQTVDIWENVGSQMRDDGPGYFSLRFWY
jgi:hypothetical protein